MPWLALQRCAAQGCTEKVRRGYCTYHAKPAWLHRVNSRHARGYNSKHITMRKRVLNEEKTCRICWDAIATIVDHIIPISGGGTNDRANYQGVCHQCHTAKTARESAGGIGG